MKKLLSFVVAMLFAATSFAQVDDVTITVLGTGIDEERATLQALRSAIEQTFGAFVSANTTILNDSLIQDEIISVSTGNVKEYKKIAVAALPNGHVSVSLTATVSINKLMSYAESKGIKAEFAGSVYAANVKLTRLKVQSIRKAYDLMVQQMEHIAKDMFDFQFAMDEPQRFQSEELGDVYYFNCKIGVVSNSASENFSNLFNKTTKELSLTDDDIVLCRRENIEFFDTRDREHLNEFDIALPFSRKEYQQSKIKIRKIVEGACHRYTIQEIGNPNNRYVYRKHKDICDDPYCQGYTMLKRYTSTYSEEDFQLYSLQWQHGITRRTPEYFDSKQCTSVKEFDPYPYICDMKFWPSELIVTETDFFSQMMLNEKYQIPDKYKEYAISKNIADTFSLSGPNLISIHEVCVAIPASTIEKFRGFELIGVSVSKDSLSSVSQACWDEFVVRGNASIMRHEVPIPMKSNNQKTSENITEASTTREQGKSTTNYRSYTRRQSAYERAVINRVVNNMFGRSYP